MAAVTASGNPEIKKSLFVDKKEELRQNENKMLSF
jgi:hypothetical protein